MLYEMSDYIQIMSETYDLSDPYTKKKVLYCNEAQRMSNIEHLTNRLYNHIKAQTDKIDFGTIPKSKGDITKVQNYQNLIDCIDIIHKMIIDYGEKTDTIDTITTAMDNIQKRQRVFEKAFTFNIDFPILVYNTIVLACVSSVSLMISTCVEYVKDSHNSFSLAFDKASYTKTKDHVLYQSLTQFNNTCRDKSIDKIFDQCIKQNAVSEASVKDVIDIAHNVYDSVKGNIKPSDIVNLYKQSPKAFKIGAIIATVGVAFTVIKALIFAIKNILYYLKYFQYKFSDWLSIQADFLQMNADNLQYREDRKGSDEHREKVRSKQMKMVEWLRKLSNFVALRDKKARVDTDNQNKQDNKPRPYNDDDDSDDGLF